MTSDYSWQALYDWQNRQDQAIQRLQTEHGVMNPQVAVLVNQVSTLNRRLAWVLTFLAMLTIAVIAAAVTISLAVK